MSCELVLRTQLLAVKKGFDPKKVKCTFESHCSGYECQYLEEETQNPRHRTFYILQGREPSPVVPQEAFYDRLEQHDAIVYPNGHDASTKKQ